MFKRINSGEQDTIRNINFSWEGQDMVGQSGDSVAAALFSSEIIAIREHPVTDQPRAPFCMMGTCFECLVEIDGIPNQQACQVTLTEGMSVCLQRGARK